MSDVKSETKTELMRSGVLIAGAFGLFQAFVELVKSLPWWNNIAMFVYPGIILLGILLFRLTPKDNKIISFAKQVAKVIFIAIGGWGVFGIVSERIQSLPFYQTYNILIYLGMVVVYVIWSNKNGKRM